VVAGAGCWAGGEKLGTQKFYDFDISYER